MTETRLFISYAHRDEENSNGRLLSIAQDLKKEFELQTGELLEMFVDRDPGSGLRWGDVWREALDSHLMQAAFFVPFLSPQFLSSTECRREFMGFHGASTGNNSEQLILPVLFVDVSSRTEKYNDEVVSLARDRQWVDFSTTRLVPRDSEEYMAKINLMATRLANALESLDIAPRGSTDTEPVIAKSGDEGVDSPGIADLLATSEQEIENVGDFIDLFTAYLVSVSDAFRSSTPGLQAASSFAAKVSTFRLLASNIDSDVHSMLEAASEFEASTAASDPGILAMFDGIDGMTEPTDQAIGLSNTIVSAAQSVGDLATRAEEARTGLAPIAKQSRDLRPQVNRMSEAFNRLGTGAAFFAEWARRAERAIERGNERET